MIGAQPYSRTSNSCRRSPSGVVPEFPRRPPRLRRGRHLRIRRTTPPASHAQQTIIPSNPCEGGSQLRADARHSQIPESADVAGADDHAIVRMPIDAVTCCARADSVASRSAGSECCACSPGLDDSRAIADSLIEIRPRQLDHDEDTARVSSRPCRRCREQRDTTGSNVGRRYIQQVGQSNPWQQNRIRHREAVTRPQPSDTTAPRTRFPLTLSGTLGYLCGGIGSLVVFALLFQPWLTAKGWDGQAQANAFGRIHAATTYLNVWSKSGPQLAHLTSVWAPLIVVAVALTVSTVLLIMRGAATGTVHAAAAISTVAVAFSVVCDVIYLQSKGSELKAMVGLGGDLGSQAGLVFRALSGKGRYPMPGSTVDSYANPDSPVGRYSHASFRSSRPRQCSSSGAMAAKPQPAPR